MNKENAVNFQTHEEPIRTSTMTQRHQACACRKTG